jgi:hypothetical protein
MSKSKSRSKHQRRRTNRLPLALLVAGGLLLVGAALFALWRSSQPATTGASVEVAGSPRLKVNQDVIDLGDVPLDRPVEVTFQLANLGDQPLRFSQEPFIEVAQGC